ncbi:MAG: alanine--tRNA ligase-related protein [Thermoplasmata archaeon]
MTEKLYYDDMNMKEFDAVVTRVEVGKIFLDRTAFYPEGGGQPNDRGYITYAGKKITVDDVQKEGDDIAHITDGSANVTVGQEVHGTIDWERRYIHMRYHTAIHIIDGIISKYHENEALLTGGQIYEDKARIDINVENFSKEFVETVISEANKVIEEGHRVYPKNLTREEAMRLPNLARTEPGRKLIESLDTVRVIVIDGLDEQSDGGTHVSNTSLVGKIILKKIENKGRRNKRIEFTLENP